MEGKAGVGVGQSSGVELGGVVTQVNAKGVIDLLDLNFDHSRLTAISVHDNIRN